MTHGYVAGYTIYRRGQWQCRVKTTDMKAQLCNRTVATVYGHTAEECDRNVAAILDALNAEYRAQLNDIIAATKEATE